MNDLSNFLIPYSEDIPRRDDYIIYNMCGGKYYSSKVSFPNFAQHFLRLNNMNHYLTMDLSSTPAHLLMFDIDVKYENIFNTKKICMEYIDKPCMSILMTLFLRFKNLTLVVAHREKGGLHLHFPEIIIGHDDYIRLCSQLQMQFEYKIPGKAEFHLDILKNATLSNSMKPNTQKYIPVRVMYFDENDQYTLDMDLTSYNKQFNIVKKNFKKRKDNAESYFRKLLCRHYDAVYEKLKEYMMPVPVVDKPLHRLSYPTIISKDEILGDDYERVAAFTYKKKLTMYINKGMQFQTNGIHWLRSYYYLKYNSFCITNFETSYHALNIWQKRNHLHCILPENVFLNVNMALKQDNYIFAEDTNPIRTILEYKNGYFFLPVFYALCRCFKMSSKILIQHLRGILDNHDLLDALDQVDSKLIDNISRDFTIDTILFCGSNMIEKCERMRDIVKIIVSQMGGALCTVSNSEQLVEYIRHIQERHFPIVKASHRNSCKKPITYMWNCIHEYWQEVNGQSEILNLINNFWSNISTFLKLNGPEDIGSIVNGVCIPHIISNVCSETNIDRKTIEMDRHKWLLRTKHGILDLLTGHVGGTVPEFFMSDRQIGIDKFSRQLLIDVRHKRENIVSTYKLLTQKSFFQLYLKKLFEDISDDLVDTLKEILLEENMYVFDDPLILSMYQMYVHLCKYSSFDYEKLMFLIDVVTSLLISTNYPRKFYIFKGLTRNGKSKFFQMITKVFGGYSHTIRALNLQSGNTHALVAQPELASSLFNCRIVMAEEVSGKLNENLIKEITGNSSTSFRNLYEQNMGGIPTAKLFASMNTAPICTATEAFKDRVIAFPFEAEFTEEGNYLKTSEQIMMNKYPLDTSDFVIDGSYEGFFLLIYQHFIHTADLSGDGIVKYRKEPLSLVEFKAEVLLMTDMFEQFKLYADIQIMNGCMTTLNELKSAIRQYLKTIKNSSVQEIDLMIRFDEEFGYLKRTGMQLDTFSDIDNFLTTDPTEDYETLELNSEEEMDDDDDEEIPKRKKAKNNFNKSCAVYYDSVVIKNLKKEKNL